MRPLEIVPLDLAQPDAGRVRLRLAFAAVSAGRHLGPVGARRIAGRQTGEHELAAGLRRVFDDLGATFTKFGQLIGSSPSLFGDAVAAEFRGCLDAGPPVPFPAVRKVVENDLGVPLDEAFARFETSPIAAASLAVVHRAMLNDGTPVAVKVLRPRVEEVVATDLAVMRPLFEWIGRQVAIGIAATFPGLVDNLEEQVREELDLRNEATSLAWFREALGTLGLTRVKIPRPFEELTGRRVLTMDLLDGVPVDDARGLAAMGVDPRPALVEMLEAWFALTLATGCFHGDIHAGNLLMDRDGRLGVVDFGIVGRLDPATAKFFRRTLEGVLGDEDAWVDVAAHFREVYGSVVQDALGLADDDMPGFVRSQVKPLFTMPFGEVDLRTMMLGDAESSPSGRRPPARTLPQKVQYWWNERRIQRGFLDSGGRGSAFDRGTFLLSKQLVYLDRYGKLYLPDMPLLWDREAFAALLARDEPTAVA